MVGQIWANLGTRIAKVRTIIYRLHHGENSVGLFRTASEFSILGKSVYVACVLFCFVAKRPSLKL
jgi:hypothetical protein